MTISGQLAQSLSAWVSTVSCLVNWMAPGMWSLIPVLGQIGFYVALCLRWAEVAGSLCEMCLPAAGFLLGTPLKMSQQFLGFVNGRVLTTHPTDDVGGRVFHLPGGSGSLKENDQAGETPQLLTDFICCSPTGLGNVSHGCEGTLYTHH